MKLINTLKKLFTRTPTRTVTSFDNILIRLSGMRTTMEYEISSGEPPMLSRYRIYYSGEEVRELEKSVVCDNDRILALLNSCDIIRWNGFHGAHPRNVCDGTMFRFSAVINKGETISADGSENFPKGYRELIQTLDQLLSDNNKT